MHQSLHLSSTDAPPQYACSKRIHFCTFYSWLDWCSYFSTFYGRCSTQYTCSVHLDRSQYICTHLSAVVSPHGIQSGPPPQLVAPVGCCVQHQVTSWPWHCSVAQRVQQHRLADVMVLVIRLLQPGVALADVRITCQGQRAGSAFCEPVWPSGKASRW